jgi:branched-subunit amino acid aminotransferase/4-amino-4-deoxychorismate lyase
MIVSIDGRLVSPEQATVSIFDRGFLYGDGLFETFRTWNGVAVTVEQHLDRLRASARELRLPVGSIDVQPAIAAAGGGDHRVKVIVTRGGPTIVTVEALLDIPPELSAAVVDYPLPRRRAGHKTLAYLDSWIAKDLATPADEAIRLDADGFVAEGAMSNVFIVDGGIAYTPPLGTGVLPGITRARVIAIGGRERRFSVDELRAAAEIFVTSAVRGVVPVTRLDGIVRAAGPVTATIAIMYGRQMRQQGGGSVI